MVNGYAAASLREALERRASHREAIPYAGGTDLMVENRPGAVYLFLNRVPELKKIAEDKDFIRIGAGVTFTQALENPLVPSLMKEAVSRIAAPAIRNMGTFGGNLGNGSAKADSVLIEYVCDAKIRLVSLRGERIVGVEQFYQGRKQLDLAADELIAEILLPKNNPACYNGPAQHNNFARYYYQKIGGREALAISRVSFAGVYAEKEGRITHIAAAFGAVSDTVLRFKDIETMLLGKTAADAKAMKDKYLAAYRNRLRLTTGRVSAEYRKTVCLNLLNAFLTEQGL